MLPVSSNTVIEGLCSRRATCRVTILVAMPLLLVRKFSNEAHAIAQRHKNRIAPAAGDEGSRLLIDRLVRFGEKAQALSRRRSCEFLYGDAKRDVAARVALVHRKEMKLRQLLGDIPLQVFPFAHPRAPRSISVGRIRGLLTAGAC